MQGEGKDGPSARDDRELMEAAGRGDRSAFSILVRRHGAAVLRVAGAITRDSSLAEDVAQESLLTAFQSASSFRGEGTVRAWLATIARNTALRRTRAKPAEEVDPATLDALGAAAGWGQIEPIDPEEAAEESERATELHAVLDRLSLQDREIIHLRDLGGQDTASAARILGISESAAKVRLHRARLRLMAELQRGRDDGA